MFLFIFEGERESMSGGAEREGDTESEAGSRFRAASTEPDAGLELTICEIMTWAEVGRLTDWATQVPLLFILFLKNVYLVLRERETELELGKGREREGDTESPK